MLAWFILGAAYGAAMALWIRYLWGLSVKHEGSL